MTDNNKECLIKQLNHMYPKTIFYILDKPYDIQLLYNDIKLESNCIFFTNICNIARNYLNKEESSYFSILYDYFNEIPKTLLVKKDIKMMNKENQKLFIIELQSLFPNISFNFKEANNNLYLIYDNENLNFNNNLINIACELSLKYLSAQERNRLCIVYDYDNKNKGM